MSVSIPRARLVLVAAALVASAACVGPSRTESDYKRKVANTAEAMVSAVESALLTTRLAAAGRAPAPYVALRLSESEETALSVETSFGAVQPPSPDLDHLRDEVLTTVGNAADVLEELRIAAYRGELHRLHELARDLERPLVHLRRLMEIAPT